MKLAPKCVWLLLGVMLLLTGCTVPNVPHNGAFWSKNGKFIEIEHSQTYPYAVTDSDLIINEEKPILYLSYGMFALQDLVIVNVNQNELVEISTNLVDKDTNTLKITPKESMNDGDYCLIIGDSNRIAEEQARWCFKKGDPEKIRAEATEIANAKRNRSKVAPPSPGMFYGYSNPVKYVDPSGNVPLINQYDLTNWFYEELQFNVNHIYTHQIRTLLSSVGSLSPADKLRAGFGWVYLVKDKAKWDFKHKINGLLNTTSIIFQHEGGYDWYEYSMPGNIFYGYIGRAVGFSPEMLHLGAGYAEVTDPAHEKRGESCCPKICGTVAVGSDLGPSNTVLYRFCLSMGCYYFNPDWANTYYDDPLDYQAVEFGIRLYETNKENMSFQQFQTFLTRNRTMLTKGDPKSKSIWRSIDDGFYKPEFFDGPDAAKNAPVVNALLLWPPFAND
ncbi:MAG: hypothetical protein GYA36_19940 [Veillonellaceae bacterium]|nr:hypothetical protein [Veillonellaceae bacterium]